MDDSLFLELVEEFVCEIRRGKAPDPETYATRVPQFAKRIREIFPALLLLETAASGAADLPESKSGGLPGLARSVPS